MVSGVALERDDIVSLGLLEAAWDEACIAGGAGLNCGLGRRQRPRVSHSHLETGQCDSIEELGEVAVVGGVAPAVVGGQDSHEGLVGENLGARRVPFFGLVICLLLLGPSYVSFDKSFLFEVSEAMSCRPAHVRVVLDRVEF